MAAAQSLIGGSDMDAGSPAGEVVDAPDPVAAPPHVDSQHINIQESTTREANDAVKSFREAMTVLRQSLLVLSVGNAVHGNLSDFHPQHGINDVGLKTGLITVLKAKGFEVESGYCTDSGTSDSEGSKPIDLVCKKEGYTIILALKCAKLSNLTGSQLKTDPNDYREGRNKVNEYGRLQSISKFLTELTPQDLLGFTLKSENRVNLNVLSLRDETTERLQAILGNTASFKVEAERGILFLSSVVAVSNALAWWHLEVPERGDTFRSIKTEGRSIGELVASLTEAYPEQREKAALALAMLTREEWTRQKMLGSVDVIIPALLRHARPSSREREWAVEGLANLMMDGTARDKMTEQLDVIIEALVRWLDRPNREWPKTAFIRISTDPALKGPGESLLEYVKACLVKSKDPEVPSADALASVKKLASGKEVKKFMAGNEVIVSLLEHYKEFGEANSVKQLYARKIWEGIGSTENADFAGKRSASAKK